MAIVVESYQTTAMGGGSVITKPVGLVVGDLLLAIVADDSFNFNALAAPAGWTTLFRNNLETDDNYGEVMVCYIVATATEVAASNFTFTNSEGGILYRISGAAPSSMSSGTGAVIGAQNLLLLIGASADNDTDAATFSGYSVTGGESPAFTERFDSYNPAGFRVSLGVADTVYNSTENITAYNVTITAVRDGVDDKNSYLVKIPAAQSVTGSNAVFQTSPVTFSPLTGSTQNATSDFNEISPDFLIQSGRGTTQTQWSNDAKPSTDWSNET
jgi:hypothetical protein